MRRRVITLTPLIDVVFILLVFFMLATSFNQWRVIDVGTVQSGQGIGNKGALLIEITEDGARLAGRRMTLAGLEADIRERLRAKPDQGVVVKPAVGVNLQRTIDVVDRIGAAGVRDISFMAAGGR